MKNVMKLDNYYLPWHLEQAIKEFIEYYNEKSYKIIHQFKKAFSLPKKS
jgi:hypothetical protein